MLVIQLRVTGKTRLAGEVAHFRICFLWRQRGESEEKDMPLALPVMIVFSGNY
jgi:hypothetical protein